MAASAVKDDIIWKLKIKLKIAMSKIRFYRWRIFCMKYLKPVLKIAASVLISILAELGIKYCNRE